MSDIRSPALFELFCSVMAIPRFRDRFLDQFVPELLDRSGPALDQGARRVLGAQILATFYAAGLQVPPGRLQDGASNPRTFARLVHFVAAGNPGRAQISAIGNIYRARFVAEALARGVPLHVMLSGLGDPLMLCYTRGLEEFGNVNNYLTSIPAFRQMGFVPIGMAPKDFSTDEEVNNG